MRSCTIYLTAMAFLVLTASFPVDPLEQTACSAGYDMISSRDVIPSASICTWKDDRQAALSLTFDDGLNSQVVNASPLMDLHDIQGTFFVTTNNVGIPYGGSWSEWQGLVDNGHEIGSHSITHPDLTTCSPEQLLEEVVLSKRIIEENLTGLECRTFSYPMGRYNGTVRDLVRENYIGARMDRHNITGPPGPEPSTPGDHYAVIPVNFGENSDPADLNSSINEGIISGGWVVEMIHAVGFSGYDPVPVDVFSDHLDLISSRRSQLWIDTFGEVMAYIRLRDNAEIIVEMKGPDAYDISLDSDLPPSDYDLPLTVNISIPSEWIDIRIKMDGSDLVTSPNRTAGVSFLLIELRMGDVLHLERADLHPMIGPFIDIDGSNLTFSPPNGTSSDEFAFYLNYSSEADRPPDGHPRLIIDRSGDPSKVSVFNMTMMDGNDNDLTNGCVYYWRGSFPPGSNISYRFEAEDSEGLEAISPWNYTDWMEGPVLNDPPVMQGPASYMGRDGPYPIFNWTAAIDPDDDNITYRMDLLHGPVRITWYTMNTSLQLDKELDLEIEYRAKLSCIDDRGAVSNSLYTSFNLSNEPPSPVSSMDLSVNNWGNVDVIFDRSKDADGDDVRYKLVYRKIDVPPSQGMLLEHVLRENRSLNISIEEETDYEFSLTPVDIWNASGPTISRYLVLDLPPGPVVGLTVTDLEGREDGLIIEWSPSSEIDLDHYTVLRWKADERGSNVSEAWKVNVSMERTFFIDRNVTDGEEYLYAVIASDGSLIDRMNFSIARGRPIDDVPPDHVTDLELSEWNHTDGGGRGIMLNWTRSTDLRFKEYRIYRTLEVIDDISNLTPYHAIGVNSNVNHFLDTDVLTNISYHYTVTAVDLWVNERVKGNQWEEMVLNLDEVEEGHQEQVDEDTPPYWIAVVFWVLIIAGIIMVFLSSGRSDSKYEE